MSNQPRTEKLKVRLIEAESLPQTKLDNAGSRSRVRYCQELCFEFLRRRAAVFRQRTFFLRVVEAVYRGRSVCAIFSGRTERA